LLLWTGKKLADENFIEVVNMDTKTCPKCGACWIGGQHFWSGTNKKGDETELASLVCDKFGDDTCINPARGTTKGDGWEKRLNSMEDIEKDIRRANE
jgi:hypothetical protein